MGKSYLRQYKGEMNSIIEMMSRELGLCSENRDYARIMGILTILWIKIEGKLLSSSSVAGFIKFLPPAKIHI
jgi:hypothetical protein